MELHEIIGKVAQSVSVVFETTVTLIVTLADTGFNLGNQYRTAFRIACEDHREDIWLESRGRICPTSHRQEDVEMTARLILSGTRAAVWSDFKHACVGLIRTVVEIGRCIAAEFQQTAHAVIASSIDAAAAGAEFLSDTVGKMTETPEPPMTLWERISGH